MAKKAEGTNGMTKAEAVKEALDGGITSPKKVSEHVKQTHGLDVTPGYVSTIKTSLKPANGRKKPGPKPGQKKAIQTEPSPSRGLSARDLGALADLAQRAGGLDKLEEYLSALKRVR